MARLFGLDRTRTLRRHGCCATGADRDVSDVRSQLRAQRQLLQALRDTQVEQAERLARMGGRSSSG